MSEGASDASEQLDRYARDLAETVRRERMASDQLEAALDQLRSYAQDLQRSVAKEQQRTQELEAAHQDTLLRLLRASSFRDAETGSHCKRLGSYAEILARDLGLSEEDCAIIRRAAPLHDIGKIGIPDAILLKPGRLEGDEIVAMQRHAAIGASMLGGSTSTLVQMARVIALNHHECWDGSGYPQRLAGDAIPLPGRIVKLVDVYDALRARRPYKDGFSHEEAVRRLQMGDERVRPEEFCPTVLAAFDRCADDFASVFDRMGDDAS